MNVLMEQDRIEREEGFRPSVREARRSLLVRHRADAAPAWGVGGGSMLFVRGRWHAPNAPRGRATPSEREVARFVKATWWRREEIGWPWGWTS